MRWIQTAVLLLLGAGVPGPLESQAPDRPVPYPPYESQAFRQAVEAGTRTRTGAPGPRYWQQRASYRLEASLDTATRRLTGSAAIRYENQSPDTLRTVWFHLYQNLFAPGEMRNRLVPITGGTTLERVAVQGREAAPESGYQVDGTLLQVMLPDPLPPGGAEEFAFRWHHTITPDGAPRGGDDGEVLFVSYWYPQLAVYDDLGGWQLDRYLGNAEFHMGFADYDVRITVPEGWLIGATGELQNPEGLFPRRVLDRLARAAGSDDVVSVVADAERGPGSATVRSPTGQLTWHFTAEQVRDFAFGTSPHYLWDATSAKVGDITGDGRTDRSLIQTFYRPSRRAWAWDQSARYAQHSIEYLSGYLWPYPWAQATAVDGVRSCAGMEYPMITCIGGPRDTLSLYSVIVHELAHMWFPMQVASNEKRHSWQDEGLTRFNQAQAMQAFFRGHDQEAVSRNRYLGLARQGAEVELMRHGDLYPEGSSAFGVASYDKMAVNLMALRGILGEPRFRAGYREYGSHWKGKHPAPWDLFYGFNRTAGRDLWWFWRTWWYETWTLDQAVVAVRPGRDSTVIVIGDLGLAPMPVHLAVRRVGGAVQRYEIPVGTWLSGSRQFEVRVPSQPGIASVEIDPEGQFPDIDRRNNVWRGLGGPNP